MAYDIRSYESPTCTVTVTLSNRELNLLTGGLMSHLLWATERQNSNNFSGEMAILQEQKESDCKLMERLLGTRRHEASTYAVTFSDAEVHRLSSGLAILAVAEETQKNSGNLIPEESVSLKRRERSALKLNKRLSRLCIDDLNRRKEHPMAHHDKTTRCMLRPNLRLLIVGKKGDDERRMTGGTVRWYWRARVSQSKMTSG